MIYIFTRLKYEQLINELAMNSTAAFNSLTQRLLISLPLESFKYLTIIIYIIFYLTQCLRLYSTP